MPEHGNVRLFASAVRGYHVYRDLFTASIGENLLLDESLTTPWTNTCKL